MENFSEENLDENLKNIKENNFLDKQNQSSKENSSKIFVDYAPKQSFSKKKIAIIVVTLIFVMLACVLGGVLIGANSGFGGDMPLMIEAYKNLKKYYYKDISWKEFQKNASTAMMGSVDNFTGMYSLEPTGNPVGVGVSIEGNIFNEHFLRAIYPLAPAGTSVASLWFSSFSDAESNSNWQNVEDKKIKMDVGDELVGLRIEQKFYRVKNVNVSYISKYLALSLSGDVSFIIAKTQYEDSDPATIGFYQFNMKMSSYYAETAQYFSPKELGKNDLAMIKLAEFSENSALEFAMCAEKFVKESSKPSKLILDLRGNGGGRADILCYISKFLLNPYTQKNKSKNLPIIKYDYNKGNGKQATMFYNTSSSYSGSTGNYSAEYIGDLVEGFQISVLCDGGTASCSEALIGALQFYNGVEIIGQTTYGKGVAQKICIIGGGKYQLAITNGFYYIPTLAENGNTLWTQSIHGIGFTPTLENQIDDHARPLKYDKCVHKAINNFNL